MILCQVVWVNRPLGSAAAVIDRRYNKDSYELFRAGERVLFRRSFGQRVVV
jgi:hypothetical protein